MDEIMAGLEGDPSIQFIEIVTSGESQKDWGPQSGETESRAMLVFFDGAGNQTAVFKFPNDPPGGGATVLIATAAFTARTGLRADIVMPPLLNPGSGKVCFRGNPDNRAGFTVNLCLSYGAFPAGLTEGAGPPAPALPVSGQPTSLARFQNFNFGDSTSRNEDFVLGSPSPLNTSGQTVNFPVPGPEISVAPPVVAFGNRDLALGPAAPRTITITSLGSENALTLSSVTLAGPDADQFRIRSDSGQAVLGPNSNRVVTIEFDPTTVGAKTATLRVASNDSDEPTTEVSLQGAGIDTNPCAAPDPLTSLAQDVCAQAQLIGPAILYSGSFTNANSDGFSTCIPPGSVDVWFRYVAASNGVLRISASASFSQVVGISVHGGCPGTSANQLGCVTSLSPLMLPRLQMNVSAGTELLLRLARLGGEGQFPAAGGPPITFQLSLAGPAAFDFDKNRNGINDTCEFDFGDAPAPYPTSLADNGARHRALSGLFLGHRIDPNANGVPSAAATSDNLDGPANDDDGVNWDSAPSLGRPTPLRVVASGNGLLNAWIDFNADGDWSDPGEQIFVDQPVVAGTNLFLVTVPTDAVVTNQTFARFRLSSIGGLGVTGATLDGEVEDYAVAIQNAASTTGFPGVAINEVMAGLNGDSTIQFVELSVGSTAFSREWGPPAGGTNGRAMLVFFDAAGRQSGRFVFPSNAPASGTNVLVATRAFVQRTGLAPDFIMPPELIAVAGKVAFRPNPDSPFFAGDAPLSYGGSGYFGPTDQAGPANRATLPILGATSLRRVSSSPTHRNQDYQPGAPTPQNAAGQTVSLVVAPLLEQGRTLFTRETFNGNGRTCLSCHQPGSDQFGLTPATIAAMPEDDPLFVFEKNVNILRLTARSKPSDLRGHIRGATGEAEILAGSGDTYFVFGGGQLSGVIADTNGNSGQHLGFTLGDLEGPTASNGSGRGLEDHEMLRHGRALVLENIDGFTKREVFRTSPHLLNIAKTAPYGLSGEFANLRDFSAGAVAQHAPRSMARVSGTDFREPTAEELAAMEAFMNSIVTPGVGDPTFEHFVTTEAQKRGRSLFFGNEAKCSKCHSGPTLSHSDGSLPGSVAGVNENFDTGIANLLMNGSTGSNLPTEPAGLARSTRKFNTPPLFGIRLSAPYFHDGSATNLRSAVEFYDGPEFISSPSSALTGSMPAVNDSDKVADIVSFLESLVEIPLQFTREADFGIQCVSTPGAGVFTVGVTNTGTNAVTISKVAFVGSNANQFHIANDSGETSLSPGRARRIGVEFKPSSRGSKRATLEFAATDPGIPGPLRFATALSGALVDNVATVTPQTIRFATRDINPPPGGPIPVARVVSVTNSGSGPLEFVRVSVIGTNAGDFLIVNDSGSTNLPPGGVRALSVAFAPQARGERSATLRIESVACGGAVLEVALSGTATSSFDHFEWAPIASPQGFNASFPVRISAVDRNGELIPDFTNIVSLSAASGTNSANVSASSIVITELDPGGPDAIEFMNVSGATVDISSWQVHIIDQVAVTTPLSFIFPQGSLVPPGSVFTLSENIGIGVPGSFPRFFGPFNISWVASFSNLAVQVVNTQGVVVDFATGSPLGAGIFFFPTVPASEWSGGGFPTPALDGVTSYQRIGSSDNNRASDWTIAPVSMGLLNAGLSGAFANPARVVTLSQSNTTPFQGGVWTGMLAVRTEADDVRLNADDGAGHTGRSGPFRVVGTPPTISSLPSLTLQEDTPSQLMSFNVNDVETPASALTVTATSSNTTLINPAGILLGGTGNLRTIRLQPAPNQVGTADITVQVSDGSSSASQVLRLTVLPVNDPPVLLPVGNRTVTERTAVTINVLAIDADLPNDTLTFTLLQGPVGASMDSASGIIQWFPTEQQGGTTFTFQASVRDAVGLTATTNFLAFVLKVNNAPTLDPVPPQTVFAGGLLRFTNSALDLDIPTNFLTFSLATSVPGASINPTNGVVTWTPAITQVGQTLLQPVVRDSGQPPLSATQAVNVTVVRPPMSFTPSVDFGVLCPAGPPAEIMQIGITNTGTANLVLLTAQFTGTNLAEFPVVSDTGQTNLSPGAFRWMEIAFAAQSFGRKRASFNITATTGDPMGNFSFTVPLTGALVDNTVAVNVTAVDFGARSIDDLQSPSRVIAITNLGLGPLQIDALTFLPTNGLEFQVVADQGPNPVPPGGTRQWQVFFFPQSRGAKSARFILDTLACANGHIEIPLAGVGTSTIDHFAWNPIAPTQRVSVPFPIRITALDRNNQAVTEFAGPAALSAFVALTAPHPRVVISEIDPGTPDAVEFVNVSGTALNLTGWRVFLYDDMSFASPIASFDLNGILPSNGVFTVTENGTAPGLFPNFEAGTNLFWQGSSTNIAVLLRDSVGTIVDFATTGDRLRIAFPFPIVSSQWSGPGIPAAAADQNTSYQRVGFSDRNDLSDWILAPRSLGTPHPALSVPFTDARTLESVPVSTGSFTNGVWAGNFTILEESSQVRLRVDDGSGSGHEAASDLFAVRGVPPVISAIPNQTLDEDTLSQPIQFTVSDNEQAAGALEVTAISSNTAIVPNTGLALGGAGSNRNLVILPLGNAFGVTTITVMVSDGTQTTSTSFRVTVNPAPDPPTIGFIGTKTVNELQPLSVVVSAFDADPESQLAFSLVSAPEGVAIHPTSGIVTWTPTEAQGPTNAFITLRVSDNGIPSLAATQSFPVIVFEINQPPIFAPQSNRVVHVGGVLTITNLAVDPDIPTNLIFFSLIQAPPGASLDSVNGRFTFVPSPNQAGSNLLVRIRAVDNGGPPLAATQSFNIFVLPSPLSLPAPVDFGSNCPATFPLPTRGIAFTNVGTNPVSLASLTLAAGDTVSFFLTNDTGQTVLLPGQSRSVRVGFNPMTLGFHVATLVIAGMQQQLPFAAQVQLTGTRMNNTVSLGPTALAFGSREIDTGFSSQQFFAVTNLGPSSLDSVLVRLSAGDTNDFLVTSDTGPPIVFPGGTRAFGVVFQPTRSGPRAATLTVESVACTGAVLNVALTGTGLASLHHFAWDPVPTTQSPGVSFPVRVRAVDRNNEPVTQFSGSVRLNAIGTTDLLPAKPVLITEIDIGVEAVEFMNVSGRPVDVSGWRVLMYETPVAPISSVTIPAGSLLQSSALFTVTEFGLSPGVWPNLFTGTGVNWLPGSTDLSVLLLDAEGAVVDFATLGTSGSIVNPVDIPPSHWRGAGIPATASEFITSYQRQGLSDRNDSSDWVVAPRTFNSLNPNLAQVFLSENTNVTVRMLPTNFVFFTAGQWSGNVTLFDEARSVRLRADDFAGHIGLSEPINLFAQRPTITDIADLAVDEDKVVPTVTFTVSDDLTVTSNLIVFARSSDTNFLPDSRIVVLGSAGLRGLQIKPATNQAGSTIITVTVSDGAQTNSDTFLLTVRPINDPPVMQFGDGFRENFDSVIRPALPAGWVGSSSASFQWQTVNSSFDTPPNSVFFPNPSFNTDNTLTSPTLLLGPAPNLTFRHSFRTEVCCDGGFLEVSINDSSFSNVTAMGWTFTVGGYNNSSSWRGFSGGFITTTLALPPGLAGQSVRFRWRFTSDGSLAETGWFIDSISAGSTSPTNRTANEDEAIVITVPVSDAETPAGALALNVTSSNPGLVPPANIRMGGSDSIRVITVVPATNQSGTANLTLTLSDGLLTVTQLVTLTWVAVNDPPEIVPVPDQFIDEGSNLVVRLVATDAESGTNLTFFPIILPAGASLNQLSGVIRWTPTEFQGGVFETFLIQVSDNDNPPAVVSHTFLVFVREVNSPPAVLPAQIGPTYPGGRVTALFNALDSDVPPNALRFSLVSPPSGASIDPLSGMFSWSPGMEHIGTNLISVRVTDDGMPPLSDTRTVAVRVLPGPTFQSIRVTGNSVVLFWHSIPGHSYSVQFSDQLPPVFWDDIPGIVTATSGLSTVVDTIPSAGQRFYRIQFVP